MNATSKMKKVSLYFNGYKKLSCKRIEMSGHFEDSEPLLDHKMRCVILQRFYIQRYKSILVK